MLFAQVERKELWRAPFNRKSRDISTDLSSTKEVWDFKNNTFKENTERTKLYGRRLYDQELNYLQKIRKINIDQPGLNIQDIKEALTLKSHKEVTVRDLWIKETKRMNKAKRYGNERNYASAMLGLEKDVNLNVRFEKITYSWLVNTETTLRARGL